MTLVEVLVASVLLGVGVAGLLSAAALGMRNQGRSEQRIAALYVAREKLAEVETVGPRIWSLTESSQGGERRGNVGYEWNIDITALTEGELFDVEVTVKWQGLSGDGEVELETLLNDYRAAVLMRDDERGESPVAPDAHSTGR